MQKRRRNKLRKQIMKDSKKVNILSTVRFVFVLFGLLWIVVNFVFKPVVVKGEDMYPTLNDKELILTSQISYLFAEPKRFDIVVTYSKEEATNVIKRVIGLPNDTVQYRGDTLYINGEPLYEYFIDEEYKDEMLKSETRNFTDDYGPIKLEKNEYFVYGDNRIGANESKHFEIVEEDDIVAKYLFTFELLK